jgi:hypothetical protein
MSVLFILGRTLLEIAELSVAGTLVCVKVAYVADKIERQIRSDERPPSSGTESG